MRGSRWAVRVSAASGAVALAVMGAPVHADETTYDGSATALRVEGLSLALFPELPDGVELPPELRDAPRTVVVPDTVEGQAQYQGSDTKLELPPNPLISVQAVEATSKRVDGALVSEASVAGLQLGGGAIAADLIKASCTADGSAITLDAPQARLSSNAPELGGKVELEPGRSADLTGLGTITFNVQKQSADSASVSNTVIELDSNLSLDALRDLPGDLGAGEEVVREVVADLRASNPALAQAVPEDVSGLSGQQLYGALDDAVAQLPADEVPDELDVDKVAHLSGTITIAAADCAQAVVADEPPAPKPEQPAPAAPAVKRAAPTEPPLADTGSPAAMMGAGITGLVALAGGGWALLRTRRR